MFYVYEIKIVATGEVIYVGKGTGRRYKSKKKNNFLNRMMEDNECASYIVSHYEKEEEAFEAERLRILYLKSIGQAVCNNAVYSTGGTSSYWTDERRKEKSINNPMKSKEQRDRMSKNNPMKNPDVAQRVTEAKKVPIYIGDTIYSCCGEAAQSLGIKKSTITYWISSGVTKDGLKCGKIKKEVQRIDTETVKIEHTVIYGNDEYKSVKDLSFSISVPTRTICMWLKRGFSSSGIVCRWKDDKTDYIYQKPNKIHTNKPIILDGVFYLSMLDAERDTGISTYRIRNHLNGKTSLPVKCEYANQQPSQGKSDNSTLEGSETNG